ncbi:Polysaccharide biosynthesis/export protein [Candidatus Brocadiaceae bacterium B188]|nr:MAG: hypothetical protein EX330_01640 [Candidatus Brocadia sp. BROELEC01]TWU49907.1 Polysaccharide biosynthesis/export protein [Candidatus Brocadiaceae bacterium B188]
MRIFIIHTLLTALFLILCSCSSTSTMENRPSEANAISKESPETQPVVKNIDNIRNRNQKDYRIQVKDVLYVDVYNEPELSYDQQKQRSLRVSTDGKISFPLIGEIEVAGLTPFQLERKLEELLGDGYLINPHVSVIVGNYYGTVSVIGQIKSPGEIKLQDREISVVEAISIRGGFTDIASPNRTYIVRIENGEKKIIPAKVNKIIKNKIIDDIILKSGDTVVVPEAFF